MVDEFPQAQTGTADHAFTDDTVEPDTDYAYRVKARNSAGLSPAAGDANADVPAAPAQAQQNPTLNLFAAQLRTVDADGTLISLTVELSWADPDDDVITGYRVLRKVVDAGADFAVIKADTGTTELWYSDATVEPGTRYAYRVQAIYPDDFSSLFNDVAVETDALPPPPEPTSDEGKGTNEPRQNNNPPSIVEDAKDTVVDENTGVATSFVGFGHGDPDTNPTITWEIEGGPDGDLFNITNVFQAGLLTFKSAPDYENPRDQNRNNVYLFTIKATDEHGASDTLDVTVTVLDVDEPLEFYPRPLIRPADWQIGAYWTIPENESSFKTEYMVIDPERRYKHNGADDIGWTLSGPDAAKFSVRGSGYGDRVGELTFTGAAPDYENPNDANTDGLYTVVTEARHKSGGTTVEVSQTVNFRILDVDEKPVNVRVTNHDSSTANQCGIFGGRDPGDPQSVSVNNGHSGTVATFAATDPDGDDVTWHMFGGGWTSELRDALTLSSDGVLSFTTPYDSGTMYVGGNWEDGRHNITMTIYARGKSTGKWHQDELIARCDLTVVG